MEKNKVNLLIVATGNYTQFLPGLLDSANEFFLNGTWVEYCVFTDKVEMLSKLLVVSETSVDAGDSIASIFKVEHKPWPHSTLHRFHFFKEHRDNMPEADYYFYIDADTLFVAPVTEEILSDLVGVSHCGFQGGRGTYDENRNSRAYVGPNEGTTYFGGGFFGASKDEFWKMVDVLIDAIDEDARNGVLAVHNDESHLNRYFIDNPPTKILSPSYHYPEPHPKHQRIYDNWKKLNLYFEPKILLLQKNHEKIRK